MFNRQQRGIQCCRFCGPPKRQVGCHVTCEDYIKEKKAHDEEQERYRRELGEQMDQYAICMKRKRRYHRKKE